MPVRTVEEQVRDLKERRAGAMEELVNAYTRPLLACCYALGFSEPDAEDLVQETFAAFLGAVDRFEMRSQLKTYLFGILHNKASDLRRKRRREESLDEIEETFGKRFNFLGFWSAPPQGPEQIALNSEIQDWIKRCVEGLSLSQRTALFLKEVEGETSESLCNILGVSYTNLRVILYRARVKLRECLEKNWARGG